MAEQKVGQRTFKVEALLAKEAIRLQVRLMKVVGGAVDRLPVILKGAGKEASPEDKIASDSAAVAAFMDIFSTADVDVITDLVQDLVQVAQIKRPSGAWDQVDLDGDFTGQLNQLVPVAVFVLREQFGSFFSEALALGRQKLAAKD